MKARYQFLPALLLAAGSVVSGFMATALPAWAGSGADAIIAACLARTEDDKGDRRSCIGIVADACLGSGDMSTSAQVGCYDGELKAWDVRLNTYYKKVLADLPAKSARQLRESERSWIETRKTTCAFYDVFYEGGTMARPMAADCYNRMTAERVLFLKSFADGVGDR
ncbi:UNVERIFIED_ORG: uncharacterized protein YecT (DUF1311 family) [Xanthobacter viscosus]|uniref:DUF1311 domain-containing protein n=1 Tax=Xanthobacter autotrophicus TaxID=280 RepID=A0A6C1KXQ8_XANAU|nr:lysozyme inhibitor LprI family protein [Xanthobacter autotrophicus]TLX44563.1 DUF1311 domain-containing protein [Xanthobacter autotrophicus]